MKQQDLLASTTKAQDFPGKALHCNTFVCFFGCFFFNLAQSSFCKVYPLALTKAASDSISKLSIELISIYYAPGPLVSHFPFSSSLPPDSNEESWSQHALALTLIFKLLAPRIFACSWSLADAEIGEGVWPNQETLSLSPRLFFVFGKIELFLSFLGPFFSFSLPKDLFLLFFQNS